MSFRGVEVLASGLEASLRAGAAWRKQSEAPDPLDVEDLLHSPDLAGRVFVQRVVEERHVGRPRAFRYPKPSGADFRSLTVLDPYADHFYRGLVGRGIERIESSLASEVLHVRSERLRNGAWRTVPWQRAFKTRERVLAEARERWEGGGEGTGDVQNHYYTVTHGSLGALLSSSSCSDAVVEDILNFLDDLRRIPRMSQGLPVGPEGSAPLGTLALAAADRRLGAAGIDFRRWMDDYTVWIEDQEAFERAIGLLASQLAVGHQSLNAAKCTYMPLVSGLPLEDSARGALSMIDAGYLDDDEVLAEVIEALGEQEVLRELPRVLGGLRHRGDPAAVRLLLDEPWLIERFPKQTARYFHAVSSHVAWGDVLDLVLSPTTEANAAAQLQLVRVVPSQMIESGIGARLADKARGVDRSRFGPLADHLLVAAGRSREAPRVRHERAIGMTEEMADLNTQRSALSAFCYGGARRSIRLEVRRLGRLNPDLAPTVEWALSS